MVTNLTLVNYCLIKYLEKQDLVCHHQAGFRQGYTRSNSTLGKLYANIVDLTIQKSPYADDLELFVVGF